MNSLILPHSLFLVYAFIQPVDSAPKGVGTRHLSLHHLKLHILILNKTGKRCYVSQIIYTDAWLGYYVPWQGPEDPVVTCSLQGCSDLLDRPFPQSMVQIHFRDEKHIWTINCWDVQLRLRTTESACSLQGPAEMERIEGYFFLISMSKFIYLNKMMGYTT